LSVFFICFFVTRIEKKCVGVPDENIALGKTVFQSSTYRHKEAPRAIDGDLETASCTRYTESSEPWWALDLGSPTDVSCVCVTNDRNREHGQYCFQL